MLPDIFSDSPWQMSRGERAAVRGVLASMRPALAIEIGSAEGACLVELAAGCGIVHSFDLHPPSVAQPDNVVLHTGDSHALLPELLGSLADSGDNVELVIVDGDHSPEGVRRDLEDLLDSPAVASTVILIHDTANERVRRGVDAVRFGAWPKVDHVELDWVPGRLFAEPALRDELWFGLGLVVVDSARRAYGARPVYEPRFHPAGPLLAESRALALARGAEPPAVIPAEAQADVLRLRVAALSAELSIERERDRESERDERLRAAAAREHELRARLAALEERIARADRALESITSSPSWRVTEPLRVAKRRVSRRLPR